MSRRMTAWRRSDLTYAERLCDGGFVRSSSRSRSPSTLMVVAFMLNLYQNECSDQAGSQLSREDRAHLFEPFARTRSAQTGSARGWGLGPALVHGCAEAHAGRVRVDSDAATGTTFTLELPLDARPHQPRSDEQPQVHEELAR